MSIIKKAFTVKFPYHCVDSVRCSLHKYFNAVNFGNFNSKLRAIDDETDESGGKHQRSAE